MNDPFLNVLIIGYKNSRTVQNGDFISCDPFDFEKKCLGDKKMTNHALLVFNNFLWSLSGNRKCWIVSKLRIFLSSVPIDFNLCHHQK